MITSEIITKNMLCSDIVVIFFFFWLVDWFWGGMRTNESRTGLVYFENVTAFLFQGF